ncbi:MAG: COX15/CtaA family protein [Rhodothermales bacterium]|nr:COX15/CtaA family protein [Rhodothermales bacterium]MBO6781286.1 COX15/CtaA family protein [Rhodothermales bacterium]
MRARFRFTIAAIAAAVGLLAWGAFVTSIDAGLAVPDWPTSFDSYDPFNPWPGWWKVTPILAEHGHRLAGALVGLFTLVLALWTWRSDDRAWMRRLGMAALVLVIFQGVLGGLRVALVSLDLAVVHACVAQLFFATLAAMALFTSGLWQRPGPAPTINLPKAGWLAAGAVYVQIILGALLRHPGTGIDPLLAGLHISWAFVALFAVVVHVKVLRSASGLRTLGGVLLATVVAQVALGFVAYFVLLDEAGVLQPSNLQVVVNSLHLVIGAALFSLNVVGALALARARRLSPVPA